MVKLGRQVMLKVKLNTACFLWRLLRYDRSCRCQEDFCSMAVTKRTTHAVHRKPMTIGMAFSLSVQYAKL